MSSGAKASPDFNARLFRWVAVLALAGYGVFLGWYASGAASGADQSGYLNSARLLADGKLQAELRVPPELGDPASGPRHHFTPLGFVPVPGNPHLPPIYAPGVPLHLAAVAKLAGWDAAPILVQLVTALAAVWLCYRIGRELGFSRALSAAGATTLAAFPVFLFTSLQPLSDTPATTWCLAAVWAALRSRVHGLWAVGCGVACAMAVYVRATNIVILPALVILLGLDWKRLGGALLGGLPGAAWLAWYNHTLYGGPLRSGYGPIHETFAFAYGPPTILHFGYWLVVLAPAPLLLLPLGPLVRQRTRAVFGLAAWLAAIVGVYTFYEVSRETWWCLRFILPAFPPLVLLSLLALRGLPPRRQIVASAVLALWAVGCAWYWVPSLHPLRVKQHDYEFVAASAHARTELPANALIACFYVSGSIYYYTDFPVLRWDQIEHADFVRYAERAAAAGRPIYAILFNELEDRALTERMRGTWEPVHAIARVRIWRLVEPAPTAGAR